MKPVVRSRNPASVNHQRIVIWTFQRDMRRPSVADSRIGIAETSPKGTDNLTLNGQYKLSSAFKFIGISRHRTMTAVGRVTANFFA
jgi:hypothetical protein